MGWWLPLTLMLGVLIVSGLSPERYKSRFLPQFISIPEFYAWSVSLVLFGIWYNYNWQTFCIPVWWAGILVAISFLIFLMAPIMQDQKCYDSIVAVGLGLMICIACFMFLFMQPDFIFTSIFVFPLALVVLFLMWLLKKYDHFRFLRGLLFPVFVVTGPVWLALQSVYLLRRRGRSSAIIASITVAMCFMIFLSLSVRMNTLVTEIEKTPKTRSKPFDASAITSVASNPIDVYLLDLIIGAHWKYHTELCIYDGWRPPYLDPVLAFNNLVFSEEDLFYQGFNRVYGRMIYKEVFPSRDSEFECKCARYQHHLSFREVPD